MCTALGHCSQNVVATINVFSFISLSVEYFFPEEVFQSSENTIFHKLSPVSVQCFEVIRRLEWLLLHNTVWVTLHIFQNIYHEIDIFKNKRDILFLLWVNIRRISGKCCCFWSTGWGSQEAYCICTVSLTGVIGWRFMSKHGI